MLTPPGGVQSFEFHAQNPPTVIIPAVCVVGRGPRSLSYRCICAGFLARVSSRGIPLSFNTCVIWLWRFMPKSELDQDLPNYVRSMINASCESQDLAGSRDTGSPLKRKPELDISSYAIRLLAPQSIGLLALLLCGGSTRQPSNSPRLLRVSHASARWCRVCADGLGRRLDSSDARLDSSQLLF